MGHWNDEFRVKEFLQRSADFLGWFHLWLDLICYNLMMGDLNFGFQVKIQLRTLDLEFRIILI